MRVLAVLLLATAAYAHQKNRTSCLQYLTCLQDVQSNFKNCAGGTGISLTLEAKDVNIRDLVKYRALEFVACQDRILKEIIDFESLQVLVNEDGRECFDKLPESSRRLEAFSDSCDFVAPVARNTSKGDAFQCLIDYKQDREYCETLLECCPDHSRCGERMNAVSLAYQNARAKGQQIVSNMLSCVVSNDPRFTREGNRLQSLRDPYRNAGLPFLRPDHYTEDRIARRLSLTSQSALTQRRERFTRKYQSIRQLTAQQLFDKYTTTTSAPIEALEILSTTEDPLAAVEAELGLSSSIVSEADVVAGVTETSEDTKTTESGDDVEEKSVKTEEVEKETVEKVEKLLTTTLAPELDGGQRVALVRNLIRKASDKDLAKYVALIAEGNFSKLFELAAAKEKVHVKDIDEETKAKMDKLRDVIKSTLSDKNLNSEKLVEEDLKVIAQRSAEDEKVEETTTAEPTTEAPIPTLFTIDDEQKSTKPNKNKKQLLPEARLAHTVIDRTLRMVPEVVGEKAIEKSAEVPSVDKSEQPKVKKVEEQEFEKVEGLPEKDRALLVEDEIKAAAEKTKAVEGNETIVEVEKPKVTVLDVSGEAHLVVDEVGKISSESSVEKKEDEVVEKSEAKEEGTEKTENVLRKVTETEVKTEKKKNEEATTTLAAPELVDETLLTASTQKEDVEGSGEDVTTQATIVSTEATAVEVISKIQQIRPRTEKNHCQQYAKCWQTVNDYEQQCDRKYSTDVLSHGIDDAEILSILANSSISHHEIVLKACLRPLDKSVHTTLKQLLVIQRGVRKACLDLGRNKIAVTDNEEQLCNAEIPSTSSVDEFLANEHVRSQANHLTCHAKLQPLRESCTTVRNCCASVETCDNYIASSPVKKLETEAVRRLVKRQNDCEQKMLQTLTYIHEQLSSPNRRRRYFY